MSSMKLADSVLIRIINIVQEAMVTAVDASDIMRQIRLTVDEEDPHTLVLSPEYQQQVSEQHQKLLKEAERMRSEQQGKRFVIVDGGSDKN